MTKEYDRTNTFALFTNDRREKDNDPDYNGTANIAGVEYWLSAWIKDSGKLKVSGTIKPKGAKAEGRPKPIAPDRDFYPQGDDF